MPEFFNKTYTIIQPVTTASRAFVYNNMIMSKGVSTTSYRKNLVGKKRDSVLGFCRAPSRSHTYNVLASRNRGRIPVMVTITLLLSNLDNCLYNEIEELFWLEIRLVFSDIRVLVNIKL